GAARAALLPGADAEALFRATSPGDAAAAFFIARTAGAHDILLEEAGEPYTWSSRISTFTGVPAVLGWGNHEAVWRQGWAEVQRRGADVAAIYEHPGSSEACDQLRAYGVKWMVVGDRERQRYGAAVAGPGLLLALAAARRLPRLDVRPLHHDEGTNVIFLLRLMRDGMYQYDPSNYHGPLLYFLSVVPFLLFGTTTVTLRIVPAILGTLMAPLPWLLRRELGRAGAIAAGVLLAVSPSLVYYSRDNIHEIYLVFLTLALVAAAVRGAASGRKAPVVLAGMAAGGIVATKETACLTFLALAAGLALSRGAGLGRPRRRAALMFLGAACLV